MARNKRANEKSLFEHHSHDIRVTVPTRSTLSMLHKSTNHNIHITVSTCLFMISSIVHALNFFIYPPFSALCVRIVLFCADLSRSAPMMRMMMIIWCGCCLERVPPCANQSCKCLTCVMCVCLYGHKWEHLNANKTT